MKTFRALAIAAALLAGVTACGEPADPYKPTSAEQHVFAESWSPQTEKEKNDQCAAAHLVGREGLADAARDKLKRPESFATLLIATCGREGR